MDLARELLALLDETSPTATSGHDAARGDATVVSLRDSDAWRRRAAREAESRLGGLLDLLDGPEPRLTVLGPAHSLRSV